MTDQPLTPAQAQRLIAEDQRDAAIRSGMLQWESGSLTSHQLEQVLTDALADLWQDCYRRDNYEHQGRDFVNRLRLMVRNATGVEGVL